MKSPWLSRSKFFLPILFRTTPPGVVFYGRRSGSREGSASSLAGFQNEALRPDDLGKSDGRIPHLQDARLKRFISITLPERSASPDD